MRPGPLALTVLIVAGLVGAAGCAAGSDQTGSSPSSDGASSSAAVTTTTTSAAPTTDAVAPMTFADSPRGAIEALVGAWRFDNRDLARRSADPVAVDNLFTQPAEGFSLYGCDSGEFDTSNCNYRNRSTGGYAQITAEKQPEGWIVTTVYMATDG